MIFAVKKKKKQQCKHFIKAQEINTKVELAEGC